MSIYIIIYNFNSKSLEIYSELAKKNNYDQNIHSYKSCCLYALCRYKEALEEANLAPSSQLTVNYLLITFPDSFKVSIGL